MFPGLLLAVLSAVRSSVTLGGGREGKERGNADVCGSYCIGSKAGFLWHSPIRLRMGLGSFSRFLLLFLRQMGVRRSMELIKMHNCVTRLANPSSLCGPLGICLPLNSSSSTGLGNPLPFAYIWACKQPCDCKRALAILHSVLFKEDVWQWAPSGIRIIIL